MESNKFVRGYIYTNDGKGMTNIESIIFRVVNLGDIFYFAEEISTGCIFPIYNYVVHNVNEPALFANFSYLLNGKYFVYYPLVGGEKLFTYEFDRKDGSVGSLSIPSDSEINKYLSYTEDDDLFCNKIKNMEKQNIYFCDLDSIKAKLAKLRSDNDVYDFLFFDEPIYENVPVINVKEISNYGYDLSSQNNLCNLIGREEEIKKIIKTICIRGKSLLIVGESGSGKTSLVEKLALQIKNKENDWLNNKIIFSLNLSSLISNTKYRGEFENNMKTIIDFCQHNANNVILFIDEIHNLYGLGRTDDSSIDAMNILKPYISNGTITVIGATTKLEYEKYMSNDIAFIRRFDKLELSLPDNEMNKEILLSYIKDLEVKYNIELDIDDRKKCKLVEYIVNITDTKNQRVVGDTKISNPTLCKSVIEDAFVEAVYNKQDKVTVKDISFSILSCDKLSPTFRKEKAEKLRLYLNTKNPVDSKVLSLVKN